MKALTAATTSKDLQLLAAAIESTLTILAIRAYCGSASPIDVDHLLAFVTWLGARKAQVPPTTPLLTTAKALLAKLEAYSKEMRDAVSAK